MTHVTKVGSDFRLRKSSPVSAPRVFSVTRFPALCSKSWHPAAH